MIRNNKGAILVVTIVSMMILTIIGYVTLQMVSNQNVMDTYNQTKIRVDYAAEGIVEMARGYIDFLVDKYKLPEAGPSGLEGTTTVFWGDYGDAGDPSHGKLSSILSRHGGRWDNPFQDNEGGDLDVQLETPLVDDSMYPKIYSSVYIEIVDDPMDGFSLDMHNSSNGDWLRKAYRIVGIASATVSAANGSVIVSTATCYFYTEQINVGDDTKKEIKITNHIRGWRKS